MSGERRWGRRLVLAGGLTVLVALLAACDSGNEPEVTIEDLVVGDGEMAGDRDVVVIDYVGLLADGTVFDSSEEWGALQFQLQTGIIYGLPEGQSGRVIPGLIAGVDGMKVGGVRVITIPPELAYGRSGYVTSDGVVVIPPDATLVFEVELLGVLAA